MRRELSYAPAFVAGTSGIKADDHGVASGVLSTSRELGAALGLAGLSSVVVAIAGSPTTLSGFRAGFIAAAAATAITILVSGAAPRRLGMTNVRKTDSEATRELVDTTGAMTSSWQQFAAEAADFVPQRSGSAGNGGRSSVRRAQESASL